MQEQSDIQKLDGAGYRVATRTHIGLKRRHNEDFLGVESIDSGLLLVVCDGMGGHAGGDRASRLAVASFTQTVISHHDTDEGRLRAGVEMANRDIHKESQSIDDARGMGTTLVAALVNGRHALMVNVGDSRGYLYRSGKLLRVTNDHSVVGEMVAAGELTEEQAARHPRRNVITRALGTDSHVRPDLFHLELQPGDMLLLSTDGLHGLVSDRSIAELLSQFDSPEYACDALIEAALSAGGDDNVTVGLIRIGGDDGTGGPITDPGTVPPVKEQPVKKGGTGFMLWVVLIVGLVGLGFWLLREFGGVSVSSGLDSAGTSIQDSLLTSDSVATNDSLHFADSLYGRDSLMQPTPGDEVQSGPNDLSGSFGSARNDSGRRQTGTRNTNRR